MSDVELSHAIESSGQVGDLLSNDLAPKESIRDTTT
jgi:hypothetical protein